MNSEESPYVNIKGYNYKLNISVKSSFSLISTVKKPRSEHFYISTLDTLNIQKHAAVSRKVVQTEKH